MANRLFVADQIGKIWSVDISHSASAGRKRLFADLSSRGVALGLFGINYDERGLLGLAFHPDYMHNGLVYTFQTEPRNAAPDFSTQLDVALNCDADIGASPCQSVVSEWKVRNAGNPNTSVDPTSRREMLRIDKPQFNHNGGAIAFGPDRDLYIALGDGGSADDQGPGHAREGNAQSLAPNNVLGKILRINPLGRNSRNGKYGIPVGNPFVGRSGADEIWAYGFRNPFRMSFDRMTGDLVVGDVGQNDIEEVDVVRRGGNYGWLFKEGTILFGANGDGAGFVTRNSPGRPAQMIDPIAEYDHTAPGGVRCGTSNDPKTCEGIAVVGGFVYRGTAIPALRGHYVLGDYSRAFAAPLGRLFYLNNTGMVTEPKLAGHTSLDLAVHGFAEDAAGELYVLGNTTGVVSGTTGVAVQLTAAR